MRNVLQPAASLGTNGRGRSGQSIPNVVHDVMPGKSAGKSLPPVRFVRFAKVPRYNRYHSPNRNYRNPIQCTTRWPR
jgi:hypothetical protein